MEIKLYKNYGLLAHEYSPVYSDTPLTEATKTVMLNVTVPCDIDIHGQIFVETPNIGRVLLLDILKSTENRTQNGQPFLADYKKRIYLTEREI